MRIHPLPTSLTLSVALAAVACGSDAPLAPTQTGAPALTKAERGNQVVSEQQVSINIPYIGSGGVQPDPSVCGLPAPVAGTGTLRTVVKTVETGSGRVRVTISSTASGTATGTDGSQYTWRYAQQVRQFDVSSLPTPVRVTDQFHLLGKDGAPSYKVMFHLDAVIGADGVPGEFNFTKASGNFGQCDPL
jgi:hypothetical protein